MESGLYPPIQSTPDVPEPLLKLFSQEIRIQGRLYDYAFEGRLSKSLNFLVLTQEYRQYIKFLSFESIYSFPSHCPFILYDIQVKPAPYCSLFLVKSIHRCRKMYKKTGIPKDFLISLFPQEYWKDFKFIPDFIKTQEDVQKIRAPKYAKRAIRHAFRAYFKPPIFYELLKYFHEGFLNTMTEGQMIRLYKHLKENPFIACFRESFADLFWRISSRKYKVGKKSVKDQTWILDRESQPIYCITKWKELWILDRESRPIYHVYKWKELASDTKPLHFDGSCPLWNVYMLKSFCSNHSIPITEEQLHLVNCCIGGYIAFERERMNKRITLMKSEKITQDMIDFYRNNNVLKSMKDGSLYSPRDELSDIELLNILYNKVDDLVILDSRSNMDGMYDFIISKYEDSKGDKSSPFAIFVPHVSNMLYFVGKIEKGTYFEREKPKRGRKKKTQVMLQTEDVKEYEDLGYLPIFYPQQWEVMIQEPFFTPPTRVIVFNAQEFEPSALVNIFKYLDKFNVRLQQLTIVGNSRMWCLGSKTMFNSLCKYSNVSYIKPPRKQCDSDVKYTRTAITEICDVYENEDLFAESLVEWLKNNGVKWRSKIMLFTNEALMNKLCLVTNNNILRLGMPDVLYVDALVRVEPMGLFGILKKAHMVNDRNIITEALDIYTGIFPQLHRYILKIEDYYTKTHFTIDTKYQRCTAPSFGLVKDCMSIPYEYVIFIADKTTTSQDIKKAIELTRNTCMIYYRKGIDIEKILNAESLFPRTLTEYNIQKYGMNLKKKTKRITDLWVE